ncbi:hypothetical protein D3C87_1873460 [compost metagenome]
MPIEAPVAPNRPTMLVIPRRRPKTSVTFNATRVKSFISPPNANVMPAAATLTSATAPATGPVIDS